MDTIHSAIVGSVIRDEGGVPFTSGLTELVESFRDYKSEMYKDGRWQKLGYATYPMVEFEYGFGFFVAGFNWVADYLVTPLMMLSANIAPRRAASWLGRLLSWSPPR